MASLPSAPIASEPAPARRIVILGAAGRDFHDFNVVYRDSPGTCVLAFTTAQIPGIADRHYPPVWLAR
jgi:predicted GTPase